jgi:hypothetical protein
VRTIPCQLKLRPCEAEHKIEFTDDLIDQIAYKLYGLLEEAADGETSSVIVEEG